jgi:3alpha(or 20beta)-hydroxysteroid dehydrogenase
MQDGGAIMSTASHAGRRGVPTYGAYTASKAAIIGYTKVAALELAHRNIRVNCVCPGTVDTSEGPDVPMTTVGGGLEYETTTKLPPLGRMATADEIAATFHYLASDDCRYITGQALGVDGGKTAGPALGVLMALYEQATGQQYEIGGSPH